MDAVCDGLRWMSRMDAVARHTAAMTERLLDVLRCCGDAVELYGPDRVVGGVFATA